MTPNPPSGKLTRIGDRRVVSGQPGERTNVIPIVEVVRIGKREGIDQQPIRVRLIHEDEPGRLRKWQRLQEDRVGKTQHGAVDAKAKRKRRDRRDVKPGVCFILRIAWRRP